MLNGLRRAVAVLVWSLAGLLIVAALVFAVAREAVRDAAPWAARWAAEQLGQPVRVGAPDLGFVRWRPALILDGAEVLDAQGEPQLSLTRLQLQIDPWQSLRARALRTDALVVEGLSLSLGPEDVARLRPDTPPDTGPSGALAWLLAQEDVELRDARLAWSGEAAAHEVNVRLRRAAQGHRLQGDAQLTRGGTLALDVALDAGPDWRARGSVQGDRVDLAGLAALAPELAQLARSLRFALEFDYAQGAVRGRGDLGLRGGRGSPWPVLAGPVEFAHQAGAWRAEARLAPGARAPTALALTAAGEGRAGEVRIEHLEASDVQRLIQVHAEARAAQQPALADYLRGAAPQAALSDLRLARDAAGAWSLSGGFDQLGLRAYRAAPAAAGLAGRFAVDDAGARVDLDAPQAALTFPRLFRDTLAAALRGPLVLARDAQGWYAQAEDLAVENAHAAATVRGRLRALPAAAPHLDLHVAVQRADPRGVPHYLPAGIMPAAAVAWLDAAFQGGHIPEGVVSYRGSLAAFPPPDGRFEARFPVQDLVLRFDEEWPALRGLQAELHFVDQSLTIRDARGRILDSRVSQGQADIATLRDPLLRVKARADGPAADLLRILRESPLRGHAARARGVSADGSSRLDLELALPLDRDLPQAPRWTGVVTLRDVQLRRAAVALDAVAGSVRFSEAGITHGELAGELGGARVRADLQSAAGGLRVEARGGAPGVELSRWLGLPAGILEGTARWRAELLVGHEGGWRAQLESGLQGLAVNLPEPLRKGVLAERPLRLQAGPAQGALRVDLQYGAHVARLAVQNGAVTGGFVHLGNRVAEAGGEVELPAPEDGVIRARGRLEHLELRGWPKLAGAADAAPAGQPLRWDVELERLGLTRAPSDEAQAAGRAAAPEQPRPRPEAPGMSAVGAPWSPGALPEIALRVQNLSFQGLPLGELAARVERRPRGAELAAFSLRGGVLTGEARGEWSEGAGGHTVSLTGDLEGRDITALSRAFEVWDGLSARRARIHGSVYWGGPPWQPAPASLHGELHLELREGVLHEVEPGAGRLIGLLGLSAIPRRLRLDFRDVFYDGFRFDDASGSVRFAGGRALTEDFRMNGPSARVRVQGRANLVAREYDHHVTVTPRVSQAAPIAGALAWGPQVGAIILIAQQLLRDRVDEAVQVRYRITGPWHAPQIENLGAGDVQQP